MGCCLETPDKNHNYYNKYKQNQPNNGTYTNGTYGNDYFPIDSN